MRPIAAAWLVAAGGLLTTVLAAPLGAAPAKLVLKVSPAAVTVGRGSTVPVTMTMTRRAGFVSPVLISGSSSRAGLAIAVAANPVSGPTATVQVIVAATAKTGRATLNVKAVGGGVSALVKLSVTITAGAVGANATGSAGVNPLSLEIQPGQTTSVIFQTVGARSGVPISYGASGLPTGLKAVITPAGASARFVFSAAATTKAGSYSVTLRASQGGAVFFTSALAVTVGNTPGVVTTAPIQSTSAASTAIAQTISTLTTLAATTSTTSTASTAGTATTSTTITPITTVSVVAGADLVLSRKAVAEPTGLRCSDFDAALGAPVTVTFFNSASSARVMTRQVGCENTVLVESSEKVTIPAGQSAVVTAQINSKYIFRSANDSGLRRAIQLQRSGLVDVGGVMTISVSCTGPKAYNATVKLAQGERVVIADIAPGSVCLLNDTDGLLIYWKSWDNVGINADGTVTVFQRPSGCLPATSTAPSQLNAAAPCWAEMSFAW